MTVQDVTAISGNGFIRLSCRGTGTITWEYSLDGSNRTTGWSSVGTGIDITWARANNRDQALYFRAHDADNVWQYANEVRGACLPVYAADGKFIDSQGWTICPLESSDTGVCRPFFVSSQGNDSNDGLSANSPRLTIASARQLLTTGRGDHLLFSRDSTWTGQWFGYFDLDGKSDAYPMVLGAYGNGTGTGDRPKFYHTSHNVNWLSLTSSNYTAVLSLDIDGSARTTTQDPRGIAIYGSSYALIEDTRLYKLSSGIGGGDIAAGGPNSQIIIRRSAVVSIYNNAGGGIGLYFTRTSGLVVDESLIDHCGWNEDPYVPASSQNHNTYFQVDCGPLTFRDNISARSGAESLMLRCGGQILRNLLLKSPWGMTLKTGFNDYSASPTLVKHNVVLEGRIRNPSTETSGECQGIGISQAHYVLITDNILAHRGLTTSQVSQNTGYSVDDNGDSPQYGPLGCDNITFDNNIQYKWRAGLKINNRRNINYNIAFTNNDIQEPENNVNVHRNPEYLIEIESDNGQYPGIPGFSISGNKYYAPLLASNYWFRDGYAAVGYFYDLASWNAMAGDTSSIAAAAAYPSPERTVATYQTSIGDTTATTDGFLDKAALNFRGFWDTRYTAKPVIDYVRAGFGRSPVGTGTTYNPGTAVGVDIQLLNVAGSDRSEVVYAGVPFDQGVVFTNDTLTVDGATAQTQKVQWYPMGPRWPDGSVRYARVAFRTDITALSRPAVTLMKNKTYVPITFTPLINQSLNGINVMYGFPDLGLEFYLNLTDTSHTTLLEGGGPEDHYARYRYFNRCPGREHLWVEFVFDIYSNSQRVLYWAWLGNSYIQRNLGTTPGPWPNVVFDLGRVWFGVGGVNNHIYLSDNLTHGAWRDTILTSNGTPRWTTWTLIDPNQGGVTHRHFRLGTSRCVKGSLYFGSPTDAAYLSEQVSPVTAIAMNWNGRNPPFYTTTPFPPINPDGVSREGLITTLNSRSYISDLRLLADHDPYGRMCFNLKPNPEGTGAEWYSDQSIPYLYGILAAWPLQLPILEAASRTASYRSVWLREPDGTWFKSSNYPLVSSWGHDPWNAVSWGHDYMGYNPVDRSTGMLAWSEPPYTRSSGSLHAYLPVNPFDREHYQAYYEIIAALLTADWYAVEAASALSERWISEMLLGTGNPTLDSAVSARAVGRTLRMAVMLYEATGNSSLLAQLNARVLHYYNNYFLTKCPDATLMDFSKMKFLCPKNDSDVRLADLPNTSNTYPERYYPWQEAVGVTGFIAVAHLLEKVSPGHANIARCYEMARKIAAGLILHSVLDLRGSSSANSTYTNMRHLYPRRLDPVVFPTADWAPGDFITGQTSGATGVIFFSEIVDGNPILYLFQANGDFTAGELLINNTRSVTPRYLSYQFYGFVAGRTITTNRHTSDEWPELGYGVPPDLQQHVAYIPAMQQVVHAGNASGTPGVDWVDCLRFVKWYTGYTFWMCPIVSVVLKACQENYYGSWNSQLQSLALDMLSWFKSVAAIASPNSSGAVQSSQDLMFYPFYNIEDGTINIGEMVIYAQPIIGRSTVPAVTVTGESASVSYTVTILTPVGTRSLVRPVIITTRDTSANQLINAYPCSTRAIVRQATATGQIVGTSVTVNVSTVTSHSTINQPVVYVLTYSSNTATSVVISMTLSCGPISVPVNGTPPIEG